MHIIILSLLPLLMVVSGRQVDYDLLIPDNEDHLFAALLAEGEREAALRHRRSGPGSHPHPPPPMVGDLLVGDRGKNWGNKDGPAPCCRLPRASTSRQDGTQGCRKNKQLRDHKQAGKCFMECVFTNLTLVDNGDIDMEKFKSTLIDSIQEEDKAAWMEVVGSGVDKCKAIYKDYICEDQICKSGAMELLFCVHRHAIMNCPDDRISNAEECQRMEREGHRIFEKRC